MQVKITNVVTEGERVRVFATFDEVEKTFVFFQNETKEQILANIGDEKNRLEEAEKAVNELKTSLIDTEI